MTTTLLMRVLVVDDHALVRAGIHALLQTIAGVEVVAEASDGNEALQLVSEHHPDVVLMDISMPGLNGLDAAMRITAEFPGVHVIILSMYMNEAYVLQALQAGVAGYLLKGARAAELELAITAVARGETYFSSAVSKHVVNQYISHATHGGRTTPTSPERLTPRQRETLQLITKGFTTKEIAATLNISSKTVEMHRAQLMERLGIYDIAGLVRYAIRTGIITVED